MPRRRRVDRPGQLHHVMNRAIARRTAFESRTDMRMFLAFVARAVREGRIEVHAFSILPTHFHLLVRSLDGKLARTMQRIENGYVRWFNRKRRRDGSLFRGRYRSIPVESVRYLQVLLRYIDQNAVEARVVADATTYPYGSAASQSGASQPCPWLCRTLVDRFLEPATPARGASRVAAYRRAFLHRMSPALQRFVDRRVASGARETDELDDLVGSASANVRAWMIRRAQLADGTRPGLPLVTPETIVALVSNERCRMPTARLAVGARTERCLWEIALVALLRDLAGETFEAIGRRAGLKPAETWRRYREHARAVAHDGDYAGIAADLARRALERDHGASGGGWRLPAGRRT